jgi:hypothetical protein
MVAETQLAQRRRGDLWTKARQVTLAGVALSEI